MSRVLLRHDGALYLLCQMQLRLSDGSLYLQLVRNGVSDTCWIADGVNQAKQVVLPTPAPKTKYVSIHTTGRINYRLNGQQSGMQTLNAHCLLDLKGCTWLLTYRIPAVIRLDLTEEEQGDLVVDVDTNDSLAFEFQLIAAEEPLAGNEIARLTAHSRYGLRVLLFSGVVVPQLEGAPVEAFTCIRPTFGLRRQAIDRPRCFIRYRQLQYQWGQIGGVIGPDKTGVWEAICSVPMRIHPRLVVEFDTGKYLAEPVAVEPDDVLQCVRVKFKVREKKSRSLVKHSVNIVKIYLDAELY